MSNGFSSAIYNGSGFLYSVVSKLSMCVGGIDLRLNNSDDDYSFYHVFNYSFIQPLS